MLLALAISSCRSGPPPAAPSQERSARDYAPLTIGATWTYDMMYPGQTGTMQVKLLALKDGFIVDDKNGAFRHTAEGLRDRDRYLIKHPLVPGTKWKSVVSASAVENSEIISVGQPCEAAAGRFEDCLVVEGSLKKDDKLTLHIRWTWARDIGLAKVETAVEIAGKGRIPQTKQSLRHYALNPKDAGKGLPPEGKGDDGPDTWGKE